MSRFAAIAVFTSLVLTGLLVGCKKSAPPPEAVPQLNTTKIVTPEGKTVEAGAKSPSDFAAAAKKTK